MRKISHFVRELGREISVFVDSGELDEYRRQFESSFPVPDQLGYLVGRKAPARFLSSLGGRNAPVRFVDIGANIGGVAFYAASLGMKVLAIEALPENYLFLSAGVLANGFEGVLPCHLAASNGPAILQFAGYGAWGHVPNGPTTTATLPVPALSGDEILKLYGFADADLIKIDVEGHELQVIEGLSKTLESVRPTLIIESNSWTYPQFSDYEKPLDLIRSHGYALFMYVGPDVKDDENYRIQELCVADYFCVPREKLGKVPMPRRRALGIEERIALMARELVHAGPHWWHAAHMIDRLESQHPAQAGLDALKAKIAGDSKAMEIVLRHPTPPPRWLEGRRTTL